MSTDADPTKLGNTNMVNEPDKDKEKDQTQIGKTTNVGNAVAPASAGRVASFSSGTPTAGTGSGRFTNMQKYIKANETAGDNLYGNINKGINTALDKDKSAIAEKETSANTGLSTAQTDLSRGEGYLNQLKDTGFNAQDFTSDASRLDDYGKFRTGTAVDTNALKTAANDVAGTYDTAQKAAQNSLNDVSTEEGRFGLLSKTFGSGKAAKNAYTTGQQRLDQLFLQSGGGDKVGQLQNNLKENLNNYQTGMSKFNDTYNPALQGVTDKTGMLKTGIQDQANNLETGYISDLEGQVAGINADRLTEQQRYDNFVNQLAASGKGEKIRNLDQDLFNEAKLRENEQIFNAFNNAGRPLTAEEQVIKNRMATDYKDIAKQNNVDYYDSLSKLAGINNSKLSEVGGLVDQSTGDYLKAASLRTGENSIRDMVDDAKTKFLTDAVGTTLQSRGVSEGDSGKWIGGTKDIEAYMNQNLGKYLDLGDTADQLNITSKGMGLENIAGIGATGLLGAIPGNPVNDLANGLAGAANDFTSNVLGTRQGSEFEARQRAAQNMQNQINAWLQQQGYGNYMTTNGAQSTSDMSREAFGYGDNGQLLSGVGGKLGNSYVADDVAGYYYGSGQRPAGAGNGNATVTTGDGDLIDTGTPNQNKGIIK